MAFVPFVPRPRGRPAMCTVSLSQETAVFTKLALESLGVTEATNVGIYIDTENRCIGIDANDRNGLAAISGSGRSSVVRKALLKCGAKHGDRFVVEPCDLPPVTHQIVVRPKR